MWKRDDDAEKPGQATAQGGGSPAAAGSASSDPRERAVLGASIAVQGELSGGEDLLILGRVEGKVDLTQHAVTIGKSGRVTADVFGRVVTVEGDVKGNLFGGELVTVRKSGTVTGNVTAPRVVLEDGCRLKGTVDMAAPPTDRNRPARPSLPPPVGERPLTPLAK